MRRVGALRLGRGDVVGTFSERAALSVPAAALARAREELTVAGGGPFVDAFVRRSIVDADFRLPARDIR